MFKLITLGLLALGVRAQENSHCETCKTIITSFDDMDSQNIADELCPYLGYGELCEELTPSIISWLQRNVTPDDICEELCNNHSIVRETGHHPFDLSHPETPDIHTAKETGHHPFDLSHPETPDIHTAKETGHHPFDRPHPRRSQIVTDEKDRDNPKLILLSPSKSQIV